MQPTVGADPRVCPNSGQQTPNVVPSSGATGVFRAATVWLRPIKGSKSPICDGGRGVRGGSVF